MDLRLFFSWQSDTDSKKLHHTDFIRTCIKSAISRVNKELKYVNIIYQEGMKGASGTREMIPEIGDFYYKDVEKNPWNQV